MNQAEVRDHASRGDLSFLDPQLLQDWVIAQRWFGSKGRTVSALEVLQGVPLRDDEPLLVLALIAARFPSGTHDLYQLPIGIRHSDEGWDEGVIAEVGNWTIYDGLSDPALASEMLKRMREESVARAGAERRRGAPDGCGAVELVDGLRRQAGAEVVPPARTGRQPRARAPPLPGHARVREHRAAGRLVRVRRPPGRVHARDPAGVPR